jgi:hypothetical protein
MNNDDSDWANLSYDDYSEEDSNTLIKRIEILQENKENKGKKI